MAFNVAMYEAIGKRKNTEDMSGEVFMSQAGSGTYPYAQFPLARTQAHGHTSLQGWVGDAVDFCAGKKMTLNW